VLKLLIMLEISLKAYCLPKS